MQYTQAELSDNTDFSFLFYFFVIVNPNLAPDVCSVCVESLFSLFCISVPHCCLGFVVSAFRLHQPASRRHPGAGVILLKMSFMRTKDGDKH